MDAARIVIWTPETHLFKEVMQGPGNTFSPISSKSGFGCYKKRR